MTPTTDTEGLVERIRKQFSRSGFGLLAHEAADRIQSDAATIAELRRRAAELESAEAVERIVASVIQTTWGSPGPSAHIVKSVRDGVCAALSAMGGGNG